MFNKNFVNFLARTNWNTAWNSRSTNVTKKSFHSINSQGNKLSSSPIRSGNVSSSRFLTTNDKNGLILKSSSESIRNVRDKNTYSKGVTGNEKIKESEEDDDEDDNEDDDDSDNDDKYFDKTFLEDKNLPPNFRERKVRLSSLRIDAIVSAGLNISRSKIDDYFLGSKIKLNDGKVLKKSLKVKDGDCINLTVSNEGIGGGNNTNSDQKTRAKRIRVVKVLEKDGASDKYTVYLRSWRGGIDG